MTCDVESPITLVSVSAADDLDALVGFLSHYPRESRAGWRPAFRPAGGGNTCKRRLFYLARGSARERAKKPGSFAPSQATKHPALQAVFSESDGVDP